MGEKQVYQVYAAIMKLHKKYLGRKADSVYLTALVTAINTLNSANNSNFCNAMTDVLRRWFIRGFVGLEASGIVPFYTDLWRFHKKYLGQERNDAFWEAAINEVRKLNQKYGFRELQDYVLAIMDELEYGGAENNNQGG